MFDMIDNIIKPNLEDSLEITELINGQRKLLRLPETCSHFNPRKGRVKIEYGNKSPKWRWPQKRNGAPEKSSSEPKDWHLDKTWP